MLTTYEPGDLVVCRPIHKRPFLGVVTRYDETPTPAVHICTRYTLHGDPHPFAGQARAFYVDRVSPASPAQLRRHLARLDPDA